MKTQVTISFSPGTKVLVDSGQEIAAGTAIFREGKSENLTEINLAKILKVKPKDVHKFIKKRLADEISENDLLAEKRSLLTTLSVKSPISGRIKEIDLTSGIVTISTNGSELSKKTVLPIVAKVKNIAKSNIEMEIKGEKIVGKKGGGKEQVGPLFFIPESKSFLFDIDSGVEGQVVAIKNASADIVVKLEVLGSLGIITANMDAESEFPWLAVGDDSLKDIVKHQGKKVWLRPAGKEVIVLEE